MSERPKYIIGRAEVRESGQMMMGLAPIGPRCAINTCRRPSVGTFRWPFADDMTVSLCEHHGRLIANWLKERGD
jgi:hypothetical protein